MLFLVKFCSISTIGTFSFLLKLPVPPLSSQLMFFLFLIRKQMQSGNFHKLPQPHLPTCLHLCFYRLSSLWVIRLVQEHHLGYSSLLLPNSFSFCLIVPIRVKFVISPVKQQPQYQSSFAPFPPQNYPDSLLLLQQNSSREVSIPLLFHFFLAFPSCIHSNQIFNSPPLSPPRSWPGLGSLITFILWHPVGSFQASSWPTSSFWRWWLWSHSYTFFLPSLQTLCVFFPHWLLVLSFLCSFLLFS